MRRKARPQPTTPEAVALDRKIWKCAALSSVFLWTISFRPGGTPSDREAGERNRKGGGS